jgi:polynucleotide 5'-hydroxyl-kinase GRC3/NOL9
MNKTIEAGKTLLVDGPASVCVVSGKVQIFGYVPTTGARLIVREAKRFPFYVEETALLDVSLGAGAKIEEIAADTIPSSWGAALEIFSNIQSKPAVAMVIGGADSGKSSLCNYLTNKLTTQKNSVAILDCDLGQSDVGPPATVAYAKLTKPLSDLFMLKPDGAVFVGVTSPSQATRRVLEAVAKVKAEVSSCGADFVVVNTDGWVEGDEAISYKGLLAEALMPDVVFCVERLGEVPSLCARFGDALGTFRQERVEAPASVKERTREKRKSLRELGYGKYLAGAKAKAWALSRLQFEFSDEEPPLQAPPQVEALKAAVAKRRAITRLTEARGMLVGLTDTRGGFLGVGVVLGIDFEKKTLRVHTTVSVEPAWVQLGRVQLDRDFHEVAP